MDQQQPRPFDSVAFKAALKAKVETITPKTLKEADEFKASGKVAQMKGDLTAKVSEGKGQAQGAIAEKVKEAPDTSGIEPKPVTPLPPADVGPPAQGIGAGAAAPKDKTASEVSLAQGSIQLDQQMAEAGVTEEQLERSNEPAFTSALDAKKTAQADALEAPQAYRKNEDSILSQAQGEAQTAAQGQLEAMHATRGQLLQQVAGRQLDTKGKDETKRAEVARHIQAIYEDTKQKVEARLAQLDKEVNGVFDQAASDAQHVFESHVGRRMGAYKAERYSGFGGDTLWLKDEWFGMPDKVNAFYVEGRELYLAKMDAAFDTIAGLVETGLLDAKAKIAAGKQEIQTYVAGLPISLRDVGLKAAESIQGKFDELEQSVNDKQDQLIDSLAQKYTENLQKLDARIEEMKAANQGLVDAAFSALGAAYETIKGLKNLLLGVLAKAADAIELIILDPIGFLGNLVAGVKLGFENFVGKIGQYLEKGLVDWLFGALASAGIQMPESFDPKGILSLVLQVLGLTYENIRARAAAILGEKVVSALEQAAEIFRILIAQGPGGLWEFIKDKIGDLKTLVLDEIAAFVRERIIMAGVNWIIGLLNPASAFIKACKAIYDIVIFFVERGSQILELVNAVLDSVTAIAKGNISMAANFVEKALAKAVPVVISFLAALLGLGGISDKIRAIIEKIRAPINKAIDWVIKRAVDVVKAAGKLLGVGKEEAQEEVDPQKDMGVKAGRAALHEVEKQYTKEGKIYLEDAEKVAETVKRDHPVFKSITVVDGEDTWDYEYAASPGKKEVGPKKATARMEPQVYIGFTCNSAKYDPSEYADQLEGQERGLNTLRVDEWQKNRDTYLESGRPTAASAAQEEVREQIRAELREQGKSGAEIAKHFRLLAALHEPDLVGGGRVTVKRLGSRVINSSIGAQWQTRVEVLDNAVAKIDDKHKPNLLMNVMLIMEVV